MYEIVINWLKANYDELLGSLAGILYIIFSIRHSIWLWPIGLLTSVAYILVFFKTTLYADMLLQVYYLVVSIYGWWHWKFSRNKHSNSKELNITNLKFSHWIWVVLSILLLTAIFYYPFSRYTNASNPLFDGFLTAGSFVATWLLARKVIQQWLIWIIIDAASVYLFIKKGLYLTTVLFVIYTIMAVIGYKKWRKDIVTQ